MVHQIHPSEAPDHISRLIVKMILTRTVIRPAGAQTWSNYKHNNTIKYVIAITSAGAVSFLSPGWGEKESRLWGLLKPSEEILADRGFELEASGATLHISHFTKGKK